MTGAAQPDPLHVRAGEQRVVRLFHLDLKGEHIRFLRDEPGALADLLGVAALDAAHAQVLKLADLDTLGLATYLTEGSGVAEAEVAPDRARLAALQGHVLVVLSRAFDGREQRLAPRPGVSLVAAYGQVPTDWSAQPMPTPAAAVPGAAASVAPRQARARARRIGGGVFAVVMILVALIVLAVAR